MYKSNIGILIAIIFIFPAVAFGANALHSLEITPHAGWFLFEYEDIEDNFLYGLSLTANLTAHWGAEFGFGMVETELDAFEADFDVHKAHLNLVYNFMNKKLRPYAFIGGGVGQFKQEGLTKNRDFIGRYGGGIKYYFKDWVGVRFELAHILALDNDYPNDYWHLGEASLGVVFRLMGPGLDSDRDGVPDKQDACPETPAKASVDTKGCPQDTDLDGVFDGIDECPDTPVGAFVDAVGCPSDTDGDGVFDGIDQCPDTPAGQEVGLDGCPKDTDNDGVPDIRDECPDTPPGTTVDERGCANDADGDGVQDNLDLCPDTPPGVPVDENGCILDADQDGVWDMNDKCPNTSYGAIVDVNGCEIKPREWVIEGIYFATGKATLTKDSLEKLDDMVEILKAHPEVNGEIQGHTDSVGPETLNLNLSQARAETVRDYLVSKGISAERVTARGFGEIKPIATNDTVNGRATNRRVEFYRHMPRKRSLEATATEIPEHWIVEGLTFPSGQATLTANAKTILNDVVDRLLDQPGTKYEIQGHTDNVGSDQLNLNLSEKRAQSVKDYLISKGILGERLVARGYGEVNPIASNDTAEGRKKNRRVEFVLIKE